MEDVKLKDILITLSISFFRGFVIGSVLGFIILQVLKYLN